MLLFFWFFVFFLHLFPPSSSLIFLTRISFFHSSPSFQNNNNNNNNNKKQCKRRLRLVGPAGPQQRHRVREHRAVLGRPLGHHRRRHGPPGHLLVPRLRPGRPPLLGLLRRQGHALRLHLPGALQGPGKHSLPPGRQPVQEGHGARRGRGGRARARVRRGAQQLLKRERERVRERKLGGFFLSFSLSSASFFCAVATGGWGNPKNVFFFCWK